MPTAGNQSRVVAGLWWDVGSGPVGGYLLAYWDADLGQTSAPIRDVWQRNS